MEKIMNPTAASHFAPAPLRLDGQTALVTGGTRGIGQGISLALAAAGARVVLTGRGEANGWAIVEEILAVGGQASYLAADLQDDDAVGRLVPAAIDQFGPLHILVNNAGIDADAPAMEYELEAWRRVLRFNLEVPFRLSQAAARHFVAHQGGAIINIASILGLKGATEACSYAAAKHGLIGLTKTLAIEWGSRGVRVNAVAPGLIQTDMTEYLWANARTTNAYAARLPAGRIGQPRDIGGAVVFLASDGAQFVHGETIVVDGGALAG